MTGPAAAAGQRGRRSVRPGRGHAAVTRCVGRDPRASTAGHRPRRPRRLHPSRPTGTGAHWRSLPLPPSLARPLGRRSARVSPRAAGHIGRLGSHWLTGRLGIHVGDSELMLHDKGANHRRRRAARDAARAARDVGRRCLLAARPAPPAPPGDQTCHSSTAGRRRHAQPRRGAGSIGRGAGEGGNSARKSGRL